jgi:hypothetical protein
MIMNGRYLMDIVNEQPDITFWPIISYLEELPAPTENLELKKQLEQLDKEINQLMKDASAKIIAEDDN